MSSHFPLLTHYHPEEKRPGNLLQCKYAIFIVSCIWLIKHMYPCEIVSKRVTGGKGRSLFDTYHPARATARVPTPLHTAPALTMTTKGLSLATSHSKGGGGVERGGDPCGRPAGNRCSLFTPLRSATLSTTTTMCQRGGVSSRASLLPWTCKLPCERGDRPYHTTNSFLRLFRV